MEEVVLAEDKDPEIPEQKTDAEVINKMLQDEEFARVFMKLHTPLRATKLPGRNDICPYCNSGKKFKNCECSKTHVVEYKNQYFKD